MYIIHSGDLHAISGGGPSFSNSFMAGMKGDPNFHAIFSTEALVFMGFGAVVGLPGGVAGSVGMAIVGNLFGALWGLNEYYLGANYAEAQKIIK